MVNHPDLTVSGDVAPGFEALEGAFEKILERSGGCGAALHVRVDGDVVADLWGGASGGDRTWTPDTPTVIFSCTKGLIALLVGQLVTEGRVDLDAPVSTYWPEFTGYGKERLTVRGLLAHRAGLPTVRADLGFDDIIDWDRITGLLAAERPFFDPGSTHIYHALTFGWLAGEIVRRVTGEGVGDYLQRAVAAPLGARVWIGVPEADLPSVASLTVIGAPPPPPPPPNDPDNDLVVFAPNAMTMGHALPSTIERGKGFDSSRVQAAGIPGAGGVGSARGLATIYSATVTDREAIRLLDPSTIEDMSRVQSAGEPAIPTPGPWPRWGSGFQVPSELSPMLTASSFGHDGLGGQLGFADPTLRVGFGFVTNGLYLGPAERANDLVRTLADCLAGR